MYRASWLVELVTALAVSMLLLGCGKGGGAAAGGGNAGVVPPPGASNPPPPTVTTLASEGSGILLGPHALAYSAKDNLLYVSDDGSGGACGSHCIWQVDSSSGTVNPTPVVTGNGVIEGVAFDATADNLYFSDRPSRIGKLTWNGSAYANSVTCDDIAKQSPQGPFHLVADAALGLLVADNNTLEVLRVDPCANTTVGTAFSFGGTSMLSPYGLAIGGDGTIYVSDSGNDRILTVGRATGAKAIFEGTGLVTPRGIVWLGGTSGWANQLLVANQGGSDLMGTQGAGANSLLTLAGQPIDVTTNPAGTEIYVLTQHTATDLAHIYKITGF
ncbi:MAG TPA: hypothetical protein VNM68_06950 [Candidatus Polarisedimenticolia bacterium]|nr:hypothetical protein [Candidatus Polarisedimenticolia bacterium]